MQCFGLRLMSFGARTRCFGSSSTRAPASPLQTYTPTISSRDSDLPLDGSGRTCSESQGTNRRANGGQPAEKLLISIALATVCHLPPLRVRVGDRQVYAALKRAVFLGILSVSRVLHRRVPCDWQNCRSSPFHLLGMDMAWAWERKAVILACTAMR